jgi:serine/threonine protein phosphatase PrpC
MSAAEHMARLDGELSTGTFSAGWDQLQKPETDHNYDSVYAYYDAESSNAVFGVFDGLGGQARGDPASGAVRQGLHEFMLNNAGTQFRVSILNIKKWPLKIQGPFFCKRRNY